MPDDVSYETNVPEADLVPPMTRIARNLELLLFWVRPTALAVVVIAAAEVARALGAS